jgi:hypothetical protein
MKLTEENSDGMDCRPVIDQVDMDLVPPHLRERMEKCRAGGGESQPRDIGSEFRRNGNPRRVSLNAGWYYIDVACKSRNGRGHFCFQPCTTKRVKSHAKINATSDF